MGKFSSAFTVDFERVFTDEKPVQSRHERRKKIIQKSPSRCSTGFIPNIEQVSFRVFDYWRLSSCLIPILHVKRSVWNWLFIFWTELKETLESVVHLIVKTTLELLTDCKTSNPSNTNYFLNLSIKLNIKQHKDYSANIYLFKVSNSNSKKRWEICSQSTIFLLQRRQFWCFYC